MTKKQKPLEVLIVEDQKIRLSEYVGKYVDDYRYMRSLVDSPGKYVKEGDTLTIEHIEKDWKRWENASEEMKSVISKYFPEEKMKELYDQWEQTDSIDSKDLREKLFALENKANDEYVHEKLVHRIEKETGKTINITIVPNIELALDKIKTNHYDVHIVDLGLPDNERDGCERERKYPKAQYDIIEARGLTKEDCQGIINPSVYMIKESGLLSWSGLLVADELTKQGKKYTIFTDSSHHQIGTLATYMLGEISGEEYKQIKQIPTRYDDLCKLPPVITTSKRLIVGDKSSEDCWVRVLEEAIGYQAKKKIFLPFSNLFRKYHTK